MRQQGTESELLEGWLVGWAKTESREYSYLNLQTHAISAVGNQLLSYSIPIPILILYYFSNLLHLPAQYQLTIYDEKLFSCFPISISPHQQQRYQPVPPCNVASYAYEITVDIIMYYTLSHGYKILIFFRT